MNIEISTGKLELYKNYFKIWFKKGSYSDSPLGKSGCDGYIEIHSCDKIMLEYDLFIDKKFACKGAKIGVGLCSSKYVSGGKFKDGEFSVRLMCRGDKLSGEAYCYMSKDQEIDYIDTGKGLSVGKGSFNFVKDVTVNVKMSIQLNTLGKKNGALQVYYDDELVIDEWEVNFRDDISTSINYLYISNFAGGTGSSWEMKEDTFIRVKNLIYDIH